MIRIAMDMPDEQYKKMKVIAERTGIKVSTIVKLAVDKYLQENE